ncbi:glycosyltransferase family 2 protein [Pasteurella multocida]|uniref:glycosyltransferase family 2 protein n=1 Tax=Pasteurella multocida TaxID=747 RepID=UPI00202382AA|nr:glycosyltransferase family 2 protein [Pasteurella multocida]URH98415.1 glycosyltransferase [Pasteurella multocida]
MSEIAISILVPIYNGEEYIHSLLDSILKQSFKEFEVIFIDDYSTDNSCELIKNLVGHDARFKIYTPPKKGGNAVSGLKYGLEFCTGKYFFYMSQDDLLDIGLLEKLFYQAERTRADAVVPNMEWFIENGTNNIRIIPPNVDLTVENPYAQELSGYEAFLLAIGWNIHGFYLRRTELLKRIGYDDSFLTGCEYNSRVYFYFCEKVVFCDSTFYYRQDNPNALTKYFKPHMLDDIYGYIKLLSFMKINNVDTKVVSEWHRYTARLFHLYRNKTEENFSKLSLDDRELTRAKMSELRWKFILFSLRNFRFKYIMTSFFILLFVLGK